MFHWNERGCRKYQIRMEDSLGAAPQAVEPDLELAAHLRKCGRCREALAAAELSGRLFAGLEEPEVPPSEALVTRVMAAVREAEARRSSPAAVWRPLEVLASRFALVASVVLLALSVFLGEFSPALRQADLSATATTTMGTEITNDWPEPPAQPATQDEVLMSLVDLDNGI
jgi:predicted anti-sigma-YlaC factor YlaD